VGTLRALDLLDQFGAKATFFALGWVADAAPELIRRIVDRGHEVGIRGYYHRSLKEFTPDGFREDVLRARAAVERASGQRVIGYRVPEGFLGPRDVWALRILADLDFRYDSSIKPILREWSGEPHRRFVHRQDFDGRSLWEVPFSSARLLGFDVPIAGGNYFRQWPDWMVRRAIARWDRECPAPFVMYFHTWELDPAQPRFGGAPLLARIRQYRNLDRMPGIVAHYLSRYRFTGVAEHLGLSLPRVMAPAVVRGTASADSYVTARQREGVTIVVPCYNEAGSLPYLVNTLRSVRATLGERYDVEVVLVDDGSHDSTWDVMSQLSSVEAGFRCYRHERNRGAAATILTGVRQAATPIVCSIDSDCSYDPHELEAMIPLLTDEVDVVTASPYHPLGAVKNVPRWRLALSRLASRIYRMLFRHQLHTYTSCFRVYRRDVVAAVTLRRGGFIGITEMLGRMELMGARIVEYPTTLEVRLIGQSKMRLVRTITGHLALMARLARLRLMGPAPAVRRDSATSATSDRGAA